MYNEVIEKAKVIWDYLHNFNKEESCDVIVVCCSYDLRVCDYGCEFFKRSGAGTIIFSGNQGNWTRDLWNKTEARVFSDRAIENGINKASIILEEKATNLGENIKFSKQFFNENDKVGFVSKSNTLLRIKLTAPKHLDNVSSFSGPSFRFPGEVSNIVGVYGVINEMVGDMQRIIKYPALGFQEEHLFPEEVLDSYKFLISKGYTDHLMKE